MLFQLCKEKCMKLILFYILFALFSDIQISKAFGSNESSIDIPCPVYEKGKVWRYKTHGNGFSSESAEYVKSIDNEHITTVTTMRTTIDNIGSQKSIMESTYKKGNEAIYRIALSMKNGGLDFTTTYSPPEYICGNIPLQYETVSHQKTSMQQTKTKSIILWKHLGEEQVEVPAGSFIAEVYEMITIFGSNNMPGAELSRAKTITIIYHVKNIGIVKSVNTTITQIPDLSSQQNDDETQRFFSENMNNLTADNMEEKIKQFEHLSKGSTSSKSKIKFKEQRNVITTELTLVPTIIE